MEPVCIAYGWDFKPTYLALSTPTADHPIQRADGAVRLEGNLYQENLWYLWDLVISHPIAASCGTSLSIGTAGSAESVAHKRKVTKIHKCLRLHGRDTVSISFETGRYAHPDTTAFFKKFIKYNISDGTATEPVWTPQTRTEYDRRMHVVCSTVCTTLSIAIARTTANTLLHGANTLLMTGYTF